MENTSGGLLGPAEKNPLTLLLRWVLVVAIVVGFGYAAVAVWVMRDPDPRHQEMAAVLAQKLGAIGAGGWSFVRPLLQLAIVLVIIDWVMRRFGVQLTNTKRPFEWNVQAIIAIVLVVAYAISELGGLGGGGLKDVVLVVVGFYFGTQKHAFEVDPGTGKIRKIDEHDNPQVGIEPKVAEAVSPKPAGPTA